MLKKGSEKDIRKTSKNSLIPEILHRIDIELKIDRQIMTQDERDE